MSLDAFFSKYNATRYLSSEKSVMTFVVGLNGAISADLMTGYSPKCIQDTVETFFLGENISPRLVIAVKKDKWSEKWSSVIELMAPDYMEEVLSGLGGGNEQEERDDEMSVETSVWNEDGDGVSMVLEMVHFDHDGDLEDLEDEFIENLKKDAMKARGWVYAKKREDVMVENEKVVVVNLKKRKLEDDEAEDDEDEDTCTSDEESEDNEEDIVEIVDLDPSKVDFFVIKVNVEEH